MGKLEQSRLLALALILLVPSFSTADERVCVLSLSVDYDRCIDASDPVSACKDVLGKNPKNLNARASLCEALVRLEEFDAALETLKNGNEVHRGDSFTLDVLARMRSNVGEARSRLASPRDASDSTTLKYLLVRCGRVKDLQACEDALKMSPDSHEALSAKGNILYRQGDSVGAIQAYRASLELNPGQEGIAQHLRKAEATRKQQVERCLKSSDEILCSRLLIDGEADSHDILSHIGDLELANGRFRQARDSYSAADAAHSTTNSRAQLKIMNDAIRCLDRSDSAACVQSLEATQTGSKYRRLRAAIALSGCRNLATGMNDSSSAELTRICSVARQLNPGETVQDELAEILANADRVPPGPTPPIPSPTQEDASEGASFVTVCTELAARPGQPDEAIDFCSNPPRRGLSDSQTRQIDQVLADLRSRQLLFTNIERCENAADTSRLDSLDYCRGLASEASDPLGYERLARAVRTLEFEFNLVACREGDDGPDTIAICREALDLAASNTQRQKVENLIRDKDERLSQQRRIAELKQRCVSFDSARLAKALSDCDEALDVSPNDAELQVAAARVLDLVNQYDNEPIRVSAGKEAITF